MLSPSTRLFLLPLIVGGLSSSPAQAEDAAPTSVQTVKASVLSTLPEDYDGQRIRTELSLIAPLTGKPKALGCNKDDIPFDLGPIIRFDQPMDMMAGHFTFCATRAVAAELAALPALSGLEIEATLSVKGSKPNQQLIFSDAVIVAIHPTQLPGAQAAP